MKTKIKNLIVVSYAVMASLQLHSQGYIVPNGVTYGGLESGAVSGYRINVIDNPSGTASVWAPYTQFWLNPISKTQPTVYTNTFSFQELTDVGVRVFLALREDRLQTYCIVQGS